jgi:hypothetical protein
MLASIFPAAIVVVVSVIAFLLVALAWARPQLGRPSIEYPR